jgi:hypothetical protein
MTDQLDLRTTAQSTADDAAGHEGLRSRIGPPRPARLGEELPIFCEHCGYLLHGLPQSRCEQCRILHFRCPECGHTQPINTLRPAFQQVLGRCRAVFLCLWMLVKLNLFVWPLVGWCAMGYEWSYQYRQVSSARLSGGVTFTQVPRAVDYECVLAFLLFALPFGMVLRMTLLRWRRGYLVGLVLAALAVLGAVGGTFFRQYEREAGYGPFEHDFVTVLAMTACAIALGSTIVWALWCGAARLFLPARTASALLEWQRSCSHRVSDLSRE